MLYSVINKIILSTNINNLFVFANLHLDTWILVSNDIELGKEGTFQAST